MKETFNLALIYGSAREDRFCDTVADWAIKILKTDPDLSVDIIDPAKLDLPSRHVGNAHPGVAELQSALAEADAFLVVTPEYNHSFTGELKLLIDAAKPEWRRKPLAFVSYGGMSGGLRAVEQLRLVFAELHVVTMRDVVSFANVWDQFDPNGYPIDKAGSEAALKHMVNDLKWWSRTLRDGRYPQARAEMPEVTIS
ncbi:NAD(P)H-dependent FMN reductase [Thalassospira xiamenensis M-5 = DSM 17429]|uniref:Flavoprotein n=1 Tax=Thalassospira xiamenensis M-5 = DSM 17429 TaxID=1123366 RepID=A0AB72U940_9PROT|nr:NAD(P)H-dependent oxidoreductase [Thalassospira xiamenensis]AJD50691.1 flavoprotein [Thalassospira xiamenensis M-5 = DSM 17429]SIS74034.1 NAD(P)H-dependent FMN reductase [Thalassospira xiamenensis M-5 = DSM 17429]